MIVYMKGVFLLRRKNKFAVYAALDKDGTAYGDLYWDDGESLG